MILVTGAAGKTGQAVIRALVSKGQSVRALVRRVDQTPAVTEAGAQEMAIGDLRDQDAIQKAARGIRAIYHICPNVNPLEVGIGQNVINAARLAFVEHFVYHSVLHPQVKAMPHHWLKMSVEALIFESGIPYTILQPAGYMQNVLAEWDSIVERGVYAVPYALETRLGMVDIEDVAEVAVMTLTEPGHLHATYELAGSEVLTQTEIAATLSRVLDRPVQAETTPIETWTGQARDAGLGMYQTETLVKMFRYCEQHGFWGNPGVLKHLIGREPTRFEDFVKREVQRRSAI